ALGLEARLAGELMRLAQKIGHGGHDSMQHAILLASSRGIASMMHPAGQIGSDSHPPKGLAGPPGVRAMLIRRGARTYAIPNPPAIAAYLADVRAERADLIAERDELAAQLAALGQQHDRLRELMRSLQRALQRQFDHKHQAIETERERAIARALAADRDP